MIGKQADQTLADQASGAEYAGAKLFLESRCCWAHATSPVGSAERRWSGEMKNPPPGFASAVGWKLLLAC
jgi:hypothetical protein